MPDAPAFEIEPDAVFDVTIATDKGDIVLRLDAGLAPTTVNNFVVNARNGFYDGLTFHRVVPDFVIQGGDYRGDGNGGRSWNGRSLPGEFTPRPYVRGSLGMPRNDDPDSGGSQIFVSHRPTPHLDGRYTLFGELRSGGEVLDRIEIGDRILAVRAR
jgi:peptidyl-prolyl cis-trans isomerase B (cyclophilin B)